MSVTRIAQDQIASSPYLEKVSHAFGRAQLITAMAIPQVHVSADVVASGDAIERYLADFSSLHLSQWWRFRHVIRAGGYLQTLGGIPPPENARKRFEQVGLLVHHVASCLACAFEDIAEAALWVNRADIPLSDDGCLDSYLAAHREALHHIDWRRHLRSAAEHLYSTLTNVGGIMGAVFGDLCSLESPRSVDTLKLDETRWPEPAKAARLLSAVQDSFHLRTQSAHYWIVPHGVFSWMGVDSLVIPEKLTKGSMVEDYDEDDFRSVATYFGHTVQALTLALNFAFNSLADNVEAALKAQGYMVEAEIPAVKFERASCIIQDLPQAITKRKEIGRARARGIQYALRVVREQRQPKKGAH